MRYLKITLLYALSLASPSGGAACLGSGDPQVEALVKEIGRNPAHALNRIEQAIAQTPTTQQRTQSWLASARAVASGMLGREDGGLPDSLKQAEASLEADDPARFSLVVAELLTFGGNGEPRVAVAALEPALARQRPDAESTICAKANIAYFLSRTGHAADAFPMAAEAYRASADGGMPWARAESAATLAQIVRFQADHDYAIALNTEALAYFQKEGMHDLVSNELGMRGWAHFTGQTAAMLKAAEADFLGSVEAARLADNAIAVAYAQSGLCGLLISAKRLDEAGPYCESGYRGFVGSGDHGEYTMTIDYARYLLDRGQTDKALTLLDGALASVHHSALRSHTQLAYEARARAYATLGDHPRAYAEAQKAIDTQKAIESQVRTKSAAITRARFQTAELTRQLDRATQQSAENTRRSWLMGGSGLVALVLLGSLVFVMARHRRSFRKLAYSDMLTGIPNRRYTEEGIREMLAVAAAHHQSMTLAVLDLDNFKECNDHHGHEAGDDALYRFASAVQQMIRSGDLFGRWGGEEFLLALPNTQMDEARDIIQRIRAMAEQTELPLSPGFPLRFSAGAISVGATRLSASNLLAAADHALYQAKATGRNCTVFVETPTDPTP